MGANSMQNGQTEYLSQAEREDGVRNYQKYSFWNGLGINFINTAIVTLIAINFGATNLQLGYLSSVFHFTGVLLIILPRLFNGLRIGRVFFLAWLFRGVVCYLYVVLLRLEGQTAVVVTMVLFTLFAAFRSAGVPMVQPLQKSLVRRSDEGGIVVKIHIRLTAAALISQIASFILLSIQFFNGLIGLLVLTTAGAINNTVASVFIKRIPSRERVRYRPGKNVFVLFLQTIRHPTRGIILINRLLNLGSGILFAFGVAYLRRVVGMPANMVFVYLIAGAVSALGATYALRPFVDSIGSKPMLIIASFALVILSSLWAVAVGTLPWIVYYAMGFLTFFFLRIRILLLARLIIKTMPRRDRISYTAMIEFAGAIVGLGVGLLGGGLADWSGSASDPAVHVYSYTYAFAALLCAVSLIISLKLRDPGSLTLREAAAVLLSVKNLRAYVDIYQLDTANTHVKRETKLLSLEQSDTTVATAEIRSRFMTPDSMEKERILKSLAAYPRRELIDDIVAEVLDPNSPNRVDAIRALGAYPSKRARGALRNCLDSSDTSVEAAALYALARIGDRRHDAQIEELINNASASVGATIEAIRALVLSDEEGVILERTFEIADPVRGARFEQLVLTITIAEPSFAPSLPEFFNVENLVEGSGFSLLLDDAQETHVFADGRKSIDSFLDEGNYEAIWDWCHSAVDGIVCEDRRVERLRSALHSRRADPLTVANTLAALYLTYQIRRSYPLG